MADKIVACSHTLTMGYPFVGYLRYVDKPPRGVLSLGW